MKKPRLDRGPKLNRPIAQPQTMISNGVRQEARTGAGRRPPAVIVIQIPRCLVSALEGPTGTLQGVNAPALKSQSAASKNFAPQCSPANQGEHSRRFDQRASGEPPKGVLYWICSI